MFDDASCDRGSQGDCWFADCSAFVVRPKCLEDLNCDNKLDWPVTDKKVSTVENYKIVVQINGKKRDIINTNLNMDEKTLVNKIKNNPKTSKFLQNKNVSRIIYIKNKLINLIIK